jgi:hypothetical protein
VQQRVTALDAERADDQVNCFANGDAFAAKKAIVCRRRDGQTGVELRNDEEFS